MLIGTAQEHRSRLPTGSRMVVAVVLAGLAAGVGGIALTLLLHAVQHWAFGYTEATFLTGVERAAPSRRVVAMTIGGLVVGVGRRALRRWCWPVPSVEQALSDPDRELPVGVFTADAALQTVAVGAGASLGREGAPRQLGAAIAHLVARRLGLSTTQRRTIVACGAGGRPWLPCTTSRWAAHFSPWRYCWHRPRWPMSFRRC